MTLISLNFKKSVSVLEEVLKESKISSPVYINVRKFVLFFWKHMKKGIKNTIKVTVFKPGDNILEYCR